MNKDEYEEKINQLKNKIKSYPDFPLKGIIFWDIFSALSDADTCTLLQSLLVTTMRDKFAEAEAVIGLESRGFLFAFSLASELGIPFIPVRKKGKLPGDVISHKYDLEYGSDVMEVQKKSIKPHLKCVLIDDLLATGGTLCAAVTLLRKCGAQVLGGLVVMELVTLNGRSKIPQEIQLHSLIKYN